MCRYRLLVINPGSTSTKISVFDDDKNIFTESIFHDAPIWKASMYSSDVEGVHTLSPKV